MNDKNKLMSYEELGNVGAAIAGKMLRNKGTPCSFDPEDWLQDFYLAAWVLTSNATEKAKLGVVTKQGWEQLCGCRDDAIFVARGLNIPGIEIQFASPPADQQAVADRLETQVGRAQWRGRMKNPPKGSDIKVSCRWTSGGKKLSKRKLKKMRRNGTLNPTHSPA